LTLLWDADRVISSAGTTGIGIEIASAPVTSHDFPGCPVAASATPPTPSDHRGAKR
jgi:hypothetical protein